MYLYICRYTHIFADTHTRICIAAFIDSSVYVYLNKQPLESTPQERAGTGGSRLLLLDQALAKTALRPPCSAASRRTAAGSRPALGIGGPLPRGARVHAALFWRGRSRGRSFWGTFWIRAVPHKPRPIPRSYPADGSGPGQGCHSPLRLHALAVECSRFGRGSRLTEAPE